MTPTPKTPVKKLNERFLAAYGTLPYEEQFRLAWILSRDTGLRKAHNMTPGPNRTAFIQALARNGYHVDVEIDMWGKHPLDVMRERAERGITAVEHPNEFERSSIPALKFDFPKPYIIPTETDLSFYLANLQQMRDASVVFRGGKREHVFGHIIGPKISPYQGFDHQGEHYCGWDDSFTTGEWVEVFGVRYVKTSLPWDPSVVVWTAPGVSRYEEVYPNIGQIID